MASTPIEMTAKQITGMTTIEMRTFARTSELADHVVTEVHDAVREIERIDRDLLDEITRARRDLDNAVGAITGGDYVNEQGILQGTALRIDQGALARDRAFKRLDAALRMVKIVADSQATA